MHTENQQARTTTDRRQTTDEAVTAFQIERRVAARRADDRAKADAFNEQLARWHAYRQAA